jgi:hypothetical protein
MQVSLDLPMVVAALGALIMSVLVPALGWWVAGMVKRLDDLEDRVTRDGARATEGLSNFKLEVSQRYVTSEAVRQVEDRLTQHLVRIEKKLDERDREARHP